MLKAVESLRGKPISGPTLLGLLRTTTKSLPAASRGVSLTPERMGDDTGVEPAQKGLAPQLIVPERVIRGERNLRDLTRGLTGVNRELGIDEVEWTGFMQDVDKALEAGPDEYLLVRVLGGEMR